MSDTIHPIFWQSDGVFTPEKRVLAICSLLTQVWLHMRRSPTLAAANVCKRMTKEITRRESVEKSLKDSCIQHAELLKRSRLLQLGLRKITHRALVHQEAIHSSLRQTLQEDVAQTLLGLKTRLHDLRQQAQLNTRNLRGEITITQKLVARSARSIRKASLAFSP